MESPITELANLTFELPSWAGKLDTIIIIVGISLVIIATSILWYHWYQWAYNQTVLAMGAVYAAGLLVLLVTAIRITHTLAI